jgi:hypothetical protein
VLGDLQGLSQQTGGDLTDYAVAAAVLPFVRMVPPGLPAVPELGAQASHDDPSVRERLVDEQDVGSGTPLDDALMAEDLVALPQAPSAYDTGELGRRARLPFSAYGVTAAGERCLWSASTRPPRRKGPTWRRCWLKCGPTLRRSAEHLLRLETLMYGKMSIASGTIATGALLAAGMRTMTWAIIGGCAVVLGGLTLYRLATIKARR